MPRPSFWIVLHWFSLCLFPCVAAPGVDSESVLLSDDFESGELSRWSDVMGASDACPLLVGDWQPGAPAPHEHIEGGRALVDGKLYVLSGFEFLTVASQRSSERVDVYNPQLDVWETASSPRGEMPTAVNHVQAAVDPPYIWLAGGFGGPNVNRYLPTDEVWRYDTGADEWVAGPPLPEARASGGFVRLGRHLHYLGGLAEDRQTDRSEHWTLDLDEPLAIAQWQAAPCLPMPRNHFQALVINGLLYVVGGQFGHDGSVSDTALLHVYDPKTSLWQRLADLPHERSHAEPATLVHGGRILVLGGRDNVPGVDGETAPEVDSLHAYRPSIDEWQEVSTLEVPLISPYAAVFQNTVSVTLGGLHWDTPQLSTWRAELRLECQPTSLRARAGR